MPLWYSFIFKLLIQFRYTPDTNAILIIIQYNLQIQFRYAPDTNAIMILIQIQLSDTVHIRSRYECHSDTYLDSAFRYRSDMLQIRIPFWHSFRFNFQIQFRCAPYTDVIMRLIQIQLADTVQIRSRHGRYSDFHSVSAYRYSSAIVSGWHL